MADGKKFEIKKYLPHAGSFAVGFVAGTAFTGFTKAGAWVVGKVKSVLPAPKA